MKEVPSTSENHQERLDNIKGELSVLPEIRFLAYDKTQETRDKLIARYPGFKEEIEFIVSVIYQMLDQFKYNAVTGNIPSQSARREESSALNISFAESFYLETSYILEHLDEKDYIKDLLCLCGDLARQLGTSREWMTARRGLIGQVGVYKYMDRLDLNPELAAPKEDAFKKVDFWGKSGDKKLAVQGKCAEFVNEPVYIDSREKLDSWVSQEVDKANKIQSVRKKEDARRTINKTKNDFIGIQRTYTKNKEIQPVIIILPWGLINYDDGSLKDEYFKDNSINS